MDRVFVVIQFFGFIPFFWFELSGDRRLCFFCFGSARTLEMYLLIVEVLPLGV